MAFEDLVPESYRVYIQSNNVIDQSGLDEQPKWFEPKVVGSVPEDGVELSSSSSWDAPLEEGGDFLSTGLQFAGVDATNKLKSFSKNVWTGAEPIEVSLNLKFITESDPYEDVVKPSLTILSMPMPIGEGSKGEERWTLGSPVVRGEGGRSISVRIGSKFNFPFILPQNSDVNFSRTYCARPNSNEAWPVASEVSFSFIASEIPLKERLGFEFTTGG